MKKLKKIKFLFFGLAFILSLSFMDKVNAKTINSDEIKGSTYVIGSYVFTREANENKGYTGKLTTPLIMLASKSIKENNLESMIIYYKTATGKWINALTGSSIEAPASFDINYTNLKLEEENTTVVKPKNPIMILDGPNTIVENTNNIQYSFQVYIDDVDDNQKKVDGLEYSIQHGSTSTGFQNLKIFDGTSEITENSSEHSDLIVGRHYHISDVVDFDYAVNESVYVHVRTYILDENGKRIYSETVISEPINLSKNLPHLVIKSEYSNPNYAVEMENSYGYILGVEQPEGYMFKPESKDFNRFAWFLTETDEQGNTKELTEYYKLNEKAMITVPKNSIRIYKAYLGYYDAQGKFKYYTSADYSKPQEFIIDTRTLTAPTIEINSYNHTIIELNLSFYNNQDENTLDYQRKGFELYRFDEYGKWELVEIGGKDTGSYQVNTQPGNYSYAIRAYAINALGEKVYSDLSNKVNVTID